MRLTPDPSDGYKKTFVKIVQDYLAHPTGRKQTQLKKLVVDTINNDPEMMSWFNVMFDWFETPHGFHVNFRVKNKPNIS